MKTISAEMMIFQDGSCGLAILPLKSTPASYVLTDDKVQIALEDGTGVEFPHNPEFVEALKLKGEVLIGEVTGTRLHRETAIKPS